MTCIVPPSAAWNLSAAALIVVLIVLAAFSRPADQVNKPAGDAKSAASTRQDNEKILNVYN